MAAHRFFTAGFLTLSLFITALPAFAQTLPDSPEYLLQPGDKISITSVGDPPLTTPSEGLEIPQDGKISFSWVRGVQAAGRTRDQLEADLVKGMSRLVRNPEIFVNLLSSPYNFIAVNGAVGKPGTFPFRKGMTLFEALSLAEGVGVMADKKVLVYRKDREGKSEFLHADLVKLYGGDASQDLVLQPGDRVLINEAEIYVSGAVKGQNKFAFRSADNIARAISAAGGVTEDADLQNAFIRRGDQVIPINLRPYLVGTDSASNPPVPLQAGDTLHIPALQSKVLVMGEVASTGPITLVPQNRDKLMDVLAQAGSTTRTADLQNVQLIRYVNGNQKVETRLDVSQKGSPSDNVILQHGDVIYVPTKRERNKQEGLFNAALILQFLNSVRGSF